MSTHEVKIVRIDALRPHTNADALEITDVWGYQCVLRKGAHNVGDLMAFIEPDYTVPLARPEFAFLDDGRGRERLRITVRKLRGEPSYGLLVPAPEGSQEGDNVMEQLGVERYEPKVHYSGVKAGVATKGPELHVPVYDLENYRKYHRMFQPEDRVIVTVKIHGTNARFVFDGEKMHAGSRTTWKREPGTELRTVTYTNKETGEEITKTFGYESCVWWEALRQNPWIESWCKANPNCVLYGEIFGPNVQGADFAYGLKNGEYGFAAFDVLRNGRWVDNGEMLDTLGLEKTVPVLYRGPLSGVDLSALAEASDNDIFPNQKVREGVVVKLEAAERWDSRHGRVALKYVSDRYLMMK